MHENSASVFFMDSAGGSRTLGGYAIQRGLDEFAQVTEIVCVEESEIGDPVLDHGEAFDAHSERIAVAIFVVSDVFVDARIDHSGTENFDPPGAFANGAAFSMADMAREVGFDGWLGEGEEVRAETDLDAGAHHFACEMFECRLEIGEGDGNGIDVETLDLVEVCAMGCIGRISAIATARVDDSNGRLMGEHGANLHGRGLGTKQETIAEPEGIAGVS